MIRVNENSADIDYDDDLILYKGEPFTGICYEETDDGTLISECIYKKGFPHGITKWWYPSGKPKAILNLHRGLSNGTCQYWHENGQLKEESNAELGVVLSRKKWDTKGNLIEEFKISEDSNNYKFIERHRELYGDW